MTEQDWSLSPEAAYEQAALQLALYQAVAEEIPAPEESEADPELDARILRVIDAQFRKVKRSTSKKAYAMKALKTAAIAVLILNLFLTTGFALSQDFRRQILQLFVTVEPTHSEIGMRDAETGREEEGICPSGYRLAWLPDESYEAAERITRSFYSTVTYQSETGGRILLDVYAADAETSIDTEGMEQTEITMAGRKLNVFRQDQRLVLIWQGSGAYYVVKTQGLTEAEAITAALSAGPAEPETGSSEE